jgi:hypothetical protein
MRAIHNTPIPDDSGEFPIPPNCTCEGVSQQLCGACARVVMEDLAEQYRELRERKV